MTLPQPTTAQAAWMKLGYGMFLHFGTSGWGDGTFPASSFAPTQLDTDQWCAVAAEAGMRYAVLTAKHHDGFCLWPTSATDYSVASSPGRVDIVGRFVDSCRRAGIRPGLYYSLWDRHCACYADDAAYADFMRTQVTELLTGYGDLVELWFDGAWDKDHPTRTWPFDPAWEHGATPGFSRGQRWEWDRLYALIHRLQPDCLVIRNTGSDRPGGMAYLPVDARTAEHFNFIYKDRLHEPPTGLLHDGAVLPIEFCTSLNPDWFWIADREYSHPSTATIMDWRRTAQAAGGNLLLNVGPDRRGLIPAFHQRFLNAARQAG